MNNIPYGSASNVLSNGSTTGRTFNYNNWYGGSVSSGFRGANDVRRSSPGCAGETKVAPNQSRSDCGDWVGALKRRQSGTIAVI